MDKEDRFIAYLIYHAYMAHFAIDASPSKSNNITWYGILAGYGYPHLTNLH